MLACLMCSVWLAMAKVAAADATGAGDWPQYRGPSSSGASTNGPALASRWPKEGPRKLWETFLAGQNGGCWGSPSVAEGRAYLMIMAWQYPVNPENLKAVVALGVPAAAIEDLRTNGLYFNSVDDWLRKHGIPGDKKRAVQEALGPAEAIDRLACLDANTGKLLWKRDTFLNRCTGEKANWGTASVPCIWHGRVYGSLSKRTVYCVDAKTGQEVWSAKTGGNHASVAVAEGVVVSTGSGLVALEAETGAELWKGGSANGEYSPALWRFGGKMYVIYDTGGVGNPLRCKELATGKDVWGCEANCQSVAVEGTYMAAKCKGGTGGKGMLAIYSISLDKPQKIGEVDITDVAACPVICKGYVYYVGCGKAVCVDAATAKVKWEEPIPVSPRHDQKGNSYSGQSLIWSSPIVADGKLFAVLDAASGGHSNGGGTEPVGMFDANPEHFETLGVADAKLWGCTSPAVAGTKLFVHTATGLACFDLAPDGAERSVGR